LSSVASVTSHLSLADMDTVPTPLSDSSVTASGTGTNFSQDSSFTKVVFQYYTVSYSHSVSHYTHSNTVRVAERVAVLGR